MNINRLLKIFNHQNYMRCIMSSKPVKGKVESNCTYPDDYKGPKPIVEQINILAEKFGLSPDEALKYVKEVLPTLELPEGAEGWFAFPSVLALAKKEFPEVICLAKQYCRAVQFILMEISISRRFRNLVERKITPSYIRTHAYTAKMLKKLAETQPGAIQVCAAQLGMRHRGKSVRRARETFEVNEFGMTSFIGGSIVFIHKERLSYDKELSFDCPGDEFNGSVFDIFSHVPYATFYRFYKKVMFGIGSTKSVNSEYGSASLFLSQ
jgi:hypothetical protein